MKKVRTLDLKGGYRCYYVHDEDVSSVKDIPWPTPEEGEPLFLAAVPLICRDYEPIVGMSPEAAAKYAKAHADMFVTHEGLNQIIRNGLIRRLDGSWDEEGIWIAHGGMPTLEDEEDEV